MDTRIYKFRWLKRNMEWSAPLDQERMQICENQFLGLYTFVGPGVINGWDVISWNDFSEDDDDKIAEKGLQYLTQEEINSLSTTIKAGLLHTDYKMCIKIDIGDGIVGVWPGFTTLDTYYAIPKTQQSGLWYVYAIPTESLSEPQKHRAEILVTSDRRYDSTYVGTYLATVYVQYDGSEHTIYKVDTENDRRINLYLLEGLAISDIRKKFLRHVHDGETDSPTQIILTTKGRQPIKTSFPPSSPILLTNPINIQISLLYGAAITQIAEYGPGNPGFDLTGTWYYSVTFVAMTENGLKESIPGSIENIIVSKKHNSVKMTWEKIVGAQYYNLYRSYEPDSSTRSCFLLHEKIYTFSYVDNGDSNITDDNGEYISPPEATADYITTIEAQINTNNTRYIGDDDSSIVSSSGSITHQDYTIPGIGEESSVFGASRAAYDRSDAQSYYRAEVWLNGEALDPNDYSLIKFDGTYGVIQLKNNISDEDVLEVVLIINTNQTQVTGILPENRIAWINADSITSGIISKRFLTPPPHYGLERIKERAYTKPFNDMRTNDYYEYYIIDPNSEIQFNDKIIFVGASSNISTDMGIPPLDSFSDSNDSTMGNGFYYNVVASTTSSTQSGSNLSSSNSGSGSSENTTGDEIDNSIQQATGLGLFSLPQPYATESTLSTTSSRSRKYVVGAAKGNYITENFQYFEPINSLPADDGIIIECIDNNIEGEKGPNSKYYETFVLLNTGKVLYTTDYFKTFTELPLYPTTSFFATAFTISTDKIPHFGTSGTDVFTGEYEYEKVLYIGGFDTVDSNESGVWQARINETLSLSDAPWTLWDCFTTTKPGVVYTIVEIVTLNLTTESGSEPIERYDRTAYVGTDIGLFVDEEYKQAINAEQIKWIYHNHMSIEDINNLPKEKRYGSINDLLVRTNDGVYITHSARYHSESNQNVTRTWWDHPLSRKIDRLWNIFDPSSYSMSTSTGIGEGSLYYFTGCEDGVWFTTDSPGEVNPFALLFDIYVENNNAIGYIPMEITVNSGHSYSWLFFEVEVYADLEADVVLVLPDEDYAKRFGYSIPSWQLVGNSLNVENANHFIGIDDVREYTYGPPNKGISTPRYGPFAGSKYDSISSSEYLKFSWSINNTTINIEFETGESFSCVNKTTLSGSGSDGAMEISTKILWIYREAYKMVLYTINNIQDHIEFMLVSNIDGEPPAWQLSQINSSSNSSTITGSGSSGSLGPQTTSTTSSSGSNSGEIDLFGNIMSMTVSTNTIKENIIMCSDNGIWLGEENNGSVVGRTYQIMIINIIPELYMDDTIISSSSYQINYISQSITFATQRQASDIILIEPYFKEYFLSNGYWEQTDADIIVFIDSDPASIPWVAYPSQGMIRFSQSLSKDRKVYVSLLKPGAYLSNIGVTPHSEIDQAYYDNTSIFTLLAQTLNPSDNMIFVRDTSVFPSNTKYIKVGSERIAVSIIDERRLLIQNSRNTEIVYPQYTPVYLVEVKNILGIEDYISMATSNKVTYNFHSLFVSNLERLILSCRRIWDDFTGQNPVLPEPTWTYDNSSATIVEGMIKSQFHIFDRDPLDSINTFDTLYRGLEPDENDYILHALSFYCSYDGKLLTEEGALIGTDHGIWRRTGTQWQLVTNCSRQIKGGATASANQIFFIKDFRGDIYAGTDIGLWYSEDGGLTWSYDSFYPQAIYNIEKGYIEWSSSRNEKITTSSLSTTTTTTTSNHYYEVFLKEDGLCFVLYKEENGNEDGQGEFWSDHISSVDGYDAYFMKQIETIGYQTINNIQYIKRNPAFFVGAENGLWLINNRKKENDDYSSFINGFNIIPTSESSFISPIIDGRLAPETRISEKLRFYDMFISPNLPYSGIDSETNNGFGNGAAIFLTNDGLRISHDWDFSKWDTTINTTWSWHSSVNFQEAPLSGKGIICNCYLIAPDTSSGYNSINSWKYWRLFLGTNKGIFYSLDGGYSWGRCNTLANGAQSVYEIKYENSKLYALTDVGMIISNDLGDNWYVNNDFDLTNTIYLQHGYQYSQVFIPEHVEITKISLYLHRRADTDLTDEDFDYIYENTSLITVKLYSTININGEIVPNILLATSATTYSYTDIIHDGWWSFLLNYTIPQASWGEPFAIVVEEFNNEYDSLTSYGMIGWITDSSAAYADGKSYKNLTGISNYTEIANRDFFFLVHYNSDNTPEETEYSVSYEQSNANNIAVTIDQNLILDTRFIFSFLIDGSGSMLWMDDHSNIKRLFDVSDPKRKDYIENLIGRLLGRSRWSFVDIWSYDSDLRQVTNRGLTRDMAEISSVLGGVVSDGTDSEIYSGGSFAFSNMSGQSIISLLERDLDYDWAIDYMESMKRIDHNYLKIIDPLYDGNVSSLSDPIHQVARDYVINDFVDSYGRIAFLVSDGWDNASGSETWEDLSLTINAIKEEKEVPLYAFGIGYSNEQSGIMAACQETDGEFFMLSTNEDQWEAAFQRLLNGNLYIWKGTYSGNIDFGENIEFIKWINLPAYIPVATNCDVKLELRWTKDFRSWSAWQEYTANEIHEINIFANFIEYKITLYEGDTVEGEAYAPYDTEYYEYGYDEATTGLYPSPVVGQLQYALVTPATNYYYTNKKEDDPILEYLLTYNAALPDNALINFGICRGNLHNWSNYETIIKELKMVLNNRENSIYYSPEIIQTGISAQVLSSDRTQWIAKKTDGTQFTWLNTDSVDVFIDNNKIDPNVIKYTVSPGNGLIDFEEPIQMGRTVKIDVTTPGEATTKVGEATTRISNRIFISNNGPWPDDASVIVYRNNKPIFTGYHTFPAEGKVQFLQYIGDSEEIRIAIRFNNEYKIGIQTVNYSDAEIDLTDFAIQYSTTQNSSIGELLEDTSDPEIRNLKLDCAYKNIDNSEINNGIEFAGDIIGNMHTVPFIWFDFYHRYAYPSTGTEIKWFRKKVDETIFSEVDLIYNRISKFISPGIILLKDATIDTIFTQGDTWKVQITPKTLYSSGTTVESNEIVLGQEYSNTIIINTPPIISNLKIYKKISAGNENPISSIVGVDSEELLLVSGRMYDYYQDDQINTYWIRFTPHIYDAIEEEKIVTYSRVMWFKNNNLLPTYDSYELLAPKISGTTGYDQWSLPAASIKSNDSWYAIIIPRDGPTSSIYSDNGPMVRTYRIEISPPASA